MNGTIGTDNSIILAQAAGFIDKGVYFNGADFASMNAANTYVRALAYGTDANTVAVDTITASKHVKLTTTPANLAAITLLSLNLTGSGVNWTTTSGNLTVPGIIKSGGGSLSTISGGNLTAGANTELVIRTDTASDLLAVSSNLIQGTGALTKSGAGTLTLSGTNTYTGGTYVNGGTLAIGGAGSLGSGSYAGAIANSGSLAYSSSAAQTLSGIISGTGTLTQSGAGTLTLSNTNTYTGGTMVTAGTMVVSADKSLGNTSGLTVSGGTLDIRGATAGTVTLGAAASLFLTAGTLNFDLGTSFDQIVSSGAGAFTISGGTFALNLGAGFLYSSSYAVLTGFGGSNSVSGVGFSGYDSTNYSASLSNTGVLSFSAIPEPSAAVLLALSLVAVVILRSRPRLKG